MDEDDLASVDWLRVWLTDDAETLSKAIKGGLDLECSESTGQGNPALQNALETGAAACAKVLVDAGADFDRRWWGGLRGPHVAAGAKGGRPLQCLALLAAAGASLSAPDEEGRTPLHWATQGNAETVEWLLERGVEPDPKARSFSMKTPLQFAARVGSGAMVDALIRSGANVRERDKEGVDALSEAFCSAPSDGSACARLLREFSVDELRGWTWTRPRQLEFGVKTENFGGGIEEALASVMGSNQEIIQWWRGACAEDERVKIEAASAPGVKAGRPRV